jgi:hypothetical protein
MLLAMLTASARHRVDAGATAVQIPLATVGNCTPVSCPATGVQMAPVTGGICT